MILIVYGTRPEYIKVKPLMVEMDKQDIKYKTLFTGQHKDIVKETASFNLDMKYYGENRLDNIIQNSPYANKKINLLTIDVEGFEMNVLKGFSLEKYLPDIVIVEFTDNSLKKQEFYYHNIQSVINSEIYKHMLLNHYSFVNWIRSDLVFVSKYISN